MVGHSCCGWWSLSPLRLYGCVAAAWPGGRRGDQLCLITQAGTPQGERLLQTLVGRHVPTAMTSAASQHSRLQPPESFYIEHDQCGWLEDLMDLLPACACFRTAYGISLMFWETASVPIQVRVCTNRLKNQVRSNEGSLLHSCNEGPLLARCPVMGMKATESADSTAVKLE